MEFRVHTEYSIFNDGHSMAIIEKRFEELQHF